VGTDRPFLSPPKVFNIALALSEADSLSQKESFGIPFSCCVKFEIIDFSLVCSCSYKTKKK
jgi:hypothetical protein